MMMIHFHIFIFGSFLPDVFDDDDDELTGCLFFPFPFSYFHIRLFPTR